MKFTNNIKLISQIIGANEEKIKQYIKEGKGPKATKTGTYKILAWKKFFEAVERSGFTVIDSKDAKIEAEDKKKKRGRPKGKVKVEEEETLADLRKKELKERIQFQKLKNEKLKNTLLTWTECIQILTRHANIVIDTLDAFRRSAEALKNIEIKKYAEDTVSEIRRKLLDDIKQLQEVKDDDPAEST